MVTHAAGNTASNACDAELCSKVKIIDFDSLLSSRSLPPLDQVTVCSDSSVSSVSSTEETEPRRRSIFHGYWEKKGGAASCLRRESPEPEESADHSTSSDDCNTYERILKINEGIPNSLRRDPDESRRSIFGVCYSSSSAPELGLIKQTGVRKTQSAPTLEKKPVGSCLRQSRFSGQRARRQSDPSVSFSSQVDIVVYERPKELWASDGWSNFFA
jgi:hypothetical protein